MAGCSPIIVHVESAAGIREGGRTGLTAVVVGLLFFASVFLAPLFGKVPTAATAPILILVGAMMIGESQHIDWADMSQAIPAFLTSMMMPFTFRCVRRAEVDERALPA
jgi:AGZA family xanthine/uracil permease-like MFS transporter